MFTVISSERFLGLGRGPRPWETDGVLLTDGLAPAGHVVSALPLRMARWGIFKAGVLLTVHPFQQRWQGTLPSHCKYPELQGPDQGNFLDSSPPRI